MQGASRAPACSCICTWVLRQTQLIVFWEVKVMGACALSNDPDLGISLMTDHTEPYNLDSEL